MKKSRFVFLSVIIGVLFCTSICVTAFAQEPNPNEEIHQNKVTMKNKWGREVEVLFANTDTGATYSDVQSIIDDDPNALSFTIYEVGKIENGEDPYPEEKDPNTRSWSPPIGSTHKYETTKTVTVPSRAVRDDFVISVAKGQTTTLKKEYSGTLTGSISGQYFNKAKLGIKLSVTCKYSVTHKFTGPTAANANSREYRVKYFREDGKYVQKDYCYKPDGYLYGIRSHGGTYQEAVKYASYSKDYKY